MLKVFTVIFSFKYNLKTLLIENFQLSLSLADPLPLNLRSIDLSTSSSSQAGKSKWCLATAAIS